MTKKKQPTKKPIAHRAPGRPREGEGVLSPEAKARFLEGVKQGLPLRHAAWAIGVDPSTVWHWRQRDPEFDRAVLAADAESQRPVIAALREKAIVECDLGAIIWYCKARIPEYREPREQPIGVDVSGKTGMQMIDHVLQEAARLAARGEISAAAFKDLADAAAKTSEVIERASLEDRIRRLEDQQGG